MTKYTDGFKISEKDMELRGPGDIFGIRQHGLPEFKIANLYEDIEILKEAQKAADDIIKHQKLQGREDYKKLHELVLIVAYILVHAQHRIQYAEYYKRDYSAKSYHYQRLYECHKLLDLFSGLVFVKVSCFLKRFIKVSGFFSGFKH
jgi:transcription-repair coupling factor (superfamily II helicase)